MAINNYSKMQRTNSHVRKWLKDNGYRNCYMFPHSRFSHDYHISHGEDTADFDGIAHHDDHLLLFQCKSNCRGPKKTLELYRELESIFNIKIFWFNKPDRRHLEVNNISTQDIKALTSKENNGN